MSIAPDAEPVLVSLVEIRQAGRPVISMLSVSGSPDLPNFSCGQSRGVRRRDYYLGARCRCSCSSVVRLATAPDLPHSASRFVFPFAAIRHEKRNPSNQNALPLHSQSQCRKCSFEQHHINFSNDHSIAVEGDVATVASGLFSVGR